MIAEEQTNPAPWEDINPPMASAPRRELPCKSSDDDLRLTFRNELTACLTLVAPVGMNEEARRDWFAVAWDTLKDIPPGDLARAARKARETCDHPSKIVPAIVKAIEGMRPWEKFIRHEPEQPRLPEPERAICTPAEMRQIMREVAEELAAQRARRERQRSATQ